MNSIATSIAVDDTPPNADLQHRATGKTRNVTVPAENQRLAEEVSHSLHTGWYSGLLRHIWVCVENGYVVLRGRVSRYYFKQLAQVAALRLDKVELLRNEIVVTRTLQQIQGAWTDAIEDKT